MIKRQWSLFESVECLDMGDAFDQLMAGFRDLLMTCWLRTDFDMHSN
jgi:hypothetical protein